MNSNNDRFPNICIFYFSYQSLAPPIFEHFWEHNIFPHINISESLKIWGNKKLWAIIFFWTNLKRLKALDQVPSNKASFLNGMPINIMKNSATNFPDLLKYVDVTPVFEKGDVTDQKSYRATSTLSNLSKIFKNLIKN